MRDQSVNLVVQPDNLRDQPVDAGGTTWIGCRAVMQFDSTAPTMDGRQTSGRKGVPYDWQRVLLDGDVADQGDSPLPSGSMTALIGLLLT